jgi:regulator of RNase E activity RraA
LKLAYSAPQYLGKLTAMHERSLRPGGATIAPADIVVLDADGAVVVAAPQAAHVLEAAQAREAHEADLRSKLLAGALTYDLHGLRALVEGKEER